MKVLLAEKDSFLRSLIVARLSTCGYQITEVDQSPQVLALLAKDNFDLVMLSSQMERVDGKMLIEEIRHHQGWMAVPIILLTEENEIAELLMSQERGFDDFLTKPLNPFVLQLRVAINIARVNQRVEANALTHLPGNASIERVIRTKIEKGEKFSVIYIDINNFKSFNDKYGFEKGDDVIKHTSKILLNTAKEVAKDGFSFVGHIGGDDFLIVLDPEFEEKFARKFIKEFDRVMPHYYSEEDRKRGSLRVTNRKGKREDFPLISCSLAGCTNLYREYSSLGEIARDATELKSFLKMQPGSSYLRDRRSSPVNDLQEAMHVLQNVGDVKPEDDERIRLGQLLLIEGLVRQDQLEIALRRHRRTGKPLGRVLIAMQVVRTEDVGSILSKQKGIPYVSLKRVEPREDIYRFFTPSFMRSNRIVALGSDEKGLKLAMCDPEDQGTIKTVERMTGLNVSPCLALEDEFDDFILQLEQKEPFFRKQTG